MASPKLRSILSSPASIGNSTKNQSWLLPAVPGMNRWDALMDACHKRARPIVMTTIAMVGGMLPAAIGLDSGGEFRAPMAVAVIGGLISSTILSLVFVPAVFVLMDDIGNGIWRVFGRFIGPVDEPTAQNEPKSAASKA